MFFIIAILSNLIKQQFRKLNDLPI